VNESHALPVNFQNGEFTSGGLWHGFYGVQGTPTFEGQSVERRTLAVTYRQTYPGLFSQSGHWSGAVLSFQRATVIFEHPTPNIRLSRTIIEQLLALPSLQYENSWLNWPAGRTTLRSRVARTVRQLEWLMTRAKFTW
jgi:hypothetical protein